VNFDSIREMILNRELATVMVDTQKKIKRQRKGECAGVSRITEPEDKMYRMSFFKRRYLNNSTSVPFGYIWSVFAHGRVVCTRDRKWGYITFMCPHCDAKYYKQQMLLTRKFKYTICPCYKNNFGVTR
jgi:uncharacterized radical SAM superfamily protein